jgi:hypothetical protein
MANEQDADLPRLTIDDLVERGRASRFQPGNQLAKGRGRPPKSYSSKRLRWSEEALRELRRIAYDRTHPLHDRHAYEAVRDLAKITTPKMREVSGRDGERLTLVDAHELVYGKPSNDEGD